VFSIFCLCVVVAYKCPSCDKVTETYSGMTKHAGLYHHLDRDRGSWKQLHGEAAHALVRRLRGGQSGPAPEASTSATPGESSRRLTLSPPRALENSADTTAAPAPNAEGDDVGEQAIGPSEEFSGLGSVSDAPLPSAVPESDPFFACTGMLSEAEELRAAVVQPPLDASVVVQEEVAPSLLSGQASVAVPDKEQASESSAAEDSSSDELACAQPPKRARSVRPIVRLAPPTREELVEWIFSYPETHPGELASHIVRLRGLTPAYEGPIAQQIDECRRVVVHYSRVLLLAHGGTSTSGDRPDDYQKTSVCPVGTDSTPVQEVVCSWYTVVCCGL